MVDLLGEGRWFLLAKLGLEDSNRKSDLEKLLSVFAGPAAAVGIENSLPTDHPWWVPALEKVTRVFISSSKDDPHLPAWWELLYPVIPFPEELLPFMESKLPHSIEPCPLLPVNTSNPPTAASSTYFLLDEPLDNTSHPPADSPSLQLVRISSSPLSGFPPLVAPSVSTQDLPTDCSLVSPSSPKKTTSVLDS